MNIAIKNILIILLTLSAVSVGITGSYIQNIYIFCLGILLAVVALIVYVFVREDLPDDDVKSNHTETIIDDSFFDSSGSSESV